MPELIRFFLKKYGAEQEKEMKEPDAEVWDAIDNQEERIAALEEWQKTVKNLNLQRLHLHQRRLLQAVPEFLWHTI